MIGFILLSAAFSALLWYLWIIFQYRDDANRRGLSGCEVARQILDAAGQSRTVVRETISADQPLLVEELFLFPEVYRRQTLYAAAQAARRAVLLTQTPEGLLPLSLVFKIRALSKWMVLPAWIFYLSGIFNTSLSSVKFFGGIVLGVVLLLGLMEFPREWEISQKAHEFLKKTGCFEADELVKLRYLLQALRLEGLIQIFTDAGWIFKRILMTPESVKE